MSMSRMILEYILNKVCYELTICKLISYIYFPNIIHALALQVNREGTVQIGGKQCNTCLHFGY